MDSLVIASVQIELKENDHEGNMKKAENITATIASESSAAVILFPELCIEGNDFTGYSRHLTDEAIETIDAFWRRMARRYNKYIVTGKVCKRHSRLFDSAVCYTPCGDILSEYDKAHLYDGERELFAAGDRCVTVNIQGFTIGLMICADLGFPEFSRAMARIGVDAFFVVSSWSRPYEDLLLLCCRARAAENSCWLVSCNRLGLEWSGRDNCGCSTAVSPSGEIIADLADKQNAYYTVELRKEEIIERRREIKWLEWLRPELYH